MAKTKRTLGIKILAAWLIFHGLTELIGLSFQYSGAILAVLALVAGVLLLLE